MNPLLLFSMLSDHTPQMTLARLRESNKGVCQRLDLGESHRHFRARIALARSRPRFLAVGHNITVTNCDVHIARQPTNVSGATHGGLPHHVVVVEVVPLKAKHLEDGHRVYHQVSCHIAVDPVTILIPAQVHNVAIIVVFRATVVMIHVPSSGTNEHIPASRLDLGHKAKLCGILRAWIEPLPAIPRIERSMIACFANHGPYHILFDQVATHEPIVEVDSRPWSVVTDVVGDGVRVRDGLEVA
mmetsp:Transcript_23481/g.61513  ORF Transcript_23481/g.61513 Transcript_23481/m.61513 type:complete len:243 (-) Transcript_23481:559-1287(-)